MERGLPLTTILSKGDKSNEKYHKNHCNALNVDVASKFQPNLSLNLITCYESSLDNKV